VRREPPYRPIEDHEIGLRVSLGRIRVVPQPKQVSHRRCQQPGNVPPAAVRRSSRVFSGAIACAFVVLPCEWLEVFGKIILASILYILLSYLQERRDYHPSEGHMTFNTMGGVLIYLAKRRRPN
jgi:hypothetical protein